MESATPELELAQSNLEDLPEVQEVKEVMEAKEMESLVKGNVHDGELALPSSGLVPPAEAEKIRQAREKQIEEELTVRNTPITKAQIKKTLEALMNKRLMFKIGNMCFELCYINVGQSRFSAKVVNPLKKD